MLRLVFLLLFTAVLLAGCTAVSPSLPDTEGPDFFFFYTDY